MLAVFGLTLLAVAASQSEIQDAQLAIVRAAAVGKDANYFKRYCVGLVAGTLPAPATRDARIASTKLRGDLRASWVERLRQISSNIVPVAECDARGEESFHIPSRSKPILVIVVGPAEVVTPHLMRFTVFSTSGFLTETYSLLEVTKKGPQWQITSEKVLLQS